MLLIGVSTHLEAQVAVQNDTTYVAKVRAIVVDYIGICSYGDHSSYQYLVLFEDLKTKERFTVKLDFSMPSLLKERKLYLIKIKRNQKESSTAILRDGSVLRNEYPNSLLNCRTCSQFEVIDIYKPRKVSKFLIR